MNMKCPDIDFSFDHFGRTSTPLHTECVTTGFLLHSLPVLMHRLRICQEIYVNLSKNDFLEKQTADLTYCESCKK